MTYDDMLRQIADGASMERDEAERVTRVFFETLAKRLGNDESRELATQLPVELQDTLGPTNPDVAKFSMDEFLDRVARSAGTEAARAEQASHAIWRAVNDAVTSGEVSDVKSQLPSTFAGIFGASVAPDTPGSSG